MSDTQVLFVPYRGGKPTKKSAGQISQQKHAAREYHRKAKLKRQSQKPKQPPPDTRRSESVTSDSHTTASKDDASASSSTELSCSLSPSTRNSSPVSVLGAGRVDPFDSRPVKDLTPYAHQMADYALTYQWPIFKFVNPNLTYQDMKTHIGHRLRVSQTSFYTTIFAAATHFALSRVGGEAPHPISMLRLEYKDRALRMMMADIKSTGQNMPDEMMHAIFALASYSSAERILPMPSRDLKNPLATSFDLDVYSRTPVEQAHIRALFQLLKQRGGLRTVQRPGFATVVGLYVSGLSKYCARADIQQI
ncbi:uncharacterized protein HMPREF1541_06218 [Cyphellophora europaea CBS 101466]|uniref:Uncharacterized protein n=1 Tax=Cyphellophora europaea (strain CBS 101466) TaxID=1220924 RepID=W2RNY6_CYPE1|nr:uncharacterized protein HMPREF1541_06218 [Cyphellophora europaea CBS 101466]ETN38187.1 hypothetical protein HMPREF1541_06218 [Cyphellophora europaea CBS 101466]